MKKKQPTTATPPPAKPAEEPLCRERYILAKSFVHCDGCGEDKAIAKGTKYLQYLADDNASHLNLCPRCLLALKFRKSSTDTPFEVHPLDFQFDKLPRRFQSAWKTLSQRLTRQLKAGQELNEAWHDVVSRLMDELGMKHLCARDYELAEQAQKFAAIRKDIEREVAALRKNLKSIKTEINAALDRMAKARLSIKVAMTRCQTGGCGACGLTDAAESMDELAAAMVDIRKAWERI